MKILHLSTTDTRGGAARGAYWLHRALRQAGVDSHMLVAASFSGDASVRTSAHGDRLCHEREKLDEEVLRHFPDREAVYFSPASFTPGDLVEEIRRIGADIINLHWVAGGFVLPEDLRGLPGRLVWTLRDMWPFTGGCHYSGDCRSYEAACGACPVLGSAEETDPTRALWERKQRAWRDAPLHLVAVSRWMAACARSSSLLAGRPVEVIPNGLSATTFAPRDKAAARRSLGLAEEATVLLFGALYSTEDPRKGFRFLQPALEKLAPRDRHPDLLVFGSAGSEVDFGSCCTPHYLGTISDDLRLSEIYSAADVTIVPSLQDACPKVPIESMACGTPVVCFDATGMRDIVDHRETGYRAHPLDADDLARGIAWVVADPERHALLSRQSRAKVEREFTLEVQAARYLAMYQCLLMAKAG